jgi:hypothetical protein
MGQGLLSRALGRSPGTRRNSPLHPRTVVTFASNSGESAGARRLRRMDAIGERGCISRGAPQRRPRFLSRRLRDAANQRPCRKVAGAVESPAEALRRLERCREAFGAIAKWLVASQIPWRRRVFSGGVASAREASRSFEVCRKAAGDAANSTEMSHILWRRCKFLGDVAKFGERSRSLHRCRKLSEFATDRAPVPCLGGGGAG